MPSWDSIPEDEKPFQRRLMEVAAGFTEHVDVQVGRVIDEIDKLGYGDNTLIFYVWGDNGSSSEGQNGTISELLAQNGIPTTVKQHIRALDELGGLDVLGSPKTDNMYVESTQLIKRPNVLLNGGGNAVLRQQFADCAIL